MNIMFLEDVISRGYESGELMFSEAMEMLDKLYEAVYNSMYDYQDSYIRKITEIRRTSPREYDGPKEVKRWVDKNYDTIMRAADALSDHKSLLSPSELRQLNNALIALLGSLVLMCVSPALSMSGGFIFCIACVLMLISSLVAAYISGQAQNRTDASMLELNKIYNALKKVPMRKLDIRTQRSIMDIMSRIEDANETYRRIEAERDRVDAERRHREELNALNNIAFSINR